jgi:flagellin-like protein
MYKKRKAITPIIATILLFAITFTVAIGDTLIQPRKKGELLPLALAIEDGLVKDVGDLVSFKVKIKNTGNQGTGYIVRVLWSEHETDEWETACIEDLWLEPEQYKEVEIGSIECSEWMAGKYFDVQFILYEHETELLLDKAIIESAWYVNKPVVAGTIIGHWVY